MASAGFNCCLAICQSKCILRFQMFQRTGTFLPDWIVYHKCSKPAERLCRTRQKIRCAQTGKIEQLFVLWKFESGNLFLVQ